MNRREFLKISGTALAAALASRLPVKADTYAESPPPASLGRIISWYQQPIRKSPEVSADIVDWKTHNQVLPLFAVLEGKAPWPSNPLWYRTTIGYIHSAYVQPVEDQKQTKFITRVIPPGLWSQVVVPVTGARYSPDSPWIARKLYYGTVYRIIDVVRDAQGQPWYQLGEGISPYSPGPFAPATDLRILSRRELKPISPGVTGKWIEINRQDQALTCYEEDEAVFQTRVATGLHDTPTPRGEYSILYKRHTRRMEGTINGDHYDLVGVPFTSYFTTTGVAIHGTYWHNDYGRQHSHGCVNVTPTAAKWIFRWVTPEITYPEYTVFSDSTNIGTRVVVV